MIATAFLSMWISNTATTIMMYAVGLSVIDFVARKTDDDRMVRNFGVALMLGIAYSASIGGVGTLIGTPPNALLASFLQSNYGIEISFFTLDAARRAGRGGDAAGHLAAADAAALSVAPHRDRRSARRRRPTSWPRWARCRAARSWSAWSSCAAASGWILRTAAGRADRAAAGRHDHRARRGAAAVRGADLARARRVRARLGGARSASPGACCCCSAAGWRWPGRSGSTGLAAVDRQRGGRRRDQHHACSCCWSRSRSST